MAKKKKRKRRSQRKQKNLERKLEEQLNLGGLRNQGKNLDIKKTKKKNKKSRKLNF